MTIFLAILLVFSLAAFIVAVVYTFKALGVGDSRWALVFFLLVLLNGTLFVVNLNSLLRLL